MLAAAKIGAGLLFHVPLCTSVFNFCLVDVNLVRGMIMSLAICASIKLAFI
jgi:hypothetical protein